jgi:hypothetical protein
MTNFSVGHESLTGKVGSRRFAYPVNHIEADHRLAFQLGRLEERFGDSARYVHLTRDLPSTAESWARRYMISPMISSYRRGMIGTEAVSRQEAATEMVEVATANIRHFLKDKSQVLSVRVEHGEEDFQKFWEWIGAEGSLDDALSEWRIRHNEGTWRPGLLISGKSAVLRAIRAAVPPR